MEKSSDSVRDSEFIPQSGNVKGGELIPQSGIPIRGGQGEENWILVQSISDEQLDKEEVGLLDGCYGRIEFHLVDLKEKKIYPNCLPSLILSAPFYAMFSLNNSVYILGGVTNAIKEESDFKLLESEIPASNLEYYFGGSSFNLKLDQSQRDEVWRPGPILIEDYGYPNCASFLGKIYSFGTESLAPKVFDPMVGNFKEICRLPPALEGSRVSIPVIADPANKRILVHLYGGQHRYPALYAFIPPTRSDSSGAWLILTFKILHWSDKAVLVDGVIYFHSRRFPSLLRAYSMDDGKWLKVHWTSPFKEGNSYFGENIDLNDFRMDFDALFSLGRNILCFAVWTPLDSDRPGKTVEVVFPKFEVERSGETISLKPLSSYTYALPATQRVPGFLPV